MCYSKYSRLLFLLLLHFLPPPLPPPPRFTAGTSNNVDDFSFLPSFVNGEREKELSQDHSVGGGYDVTSKVELDLW